MDIGVGVITIQGLEAIARGYRARLDDIDVPIMPVPLSITLVSVAIDRVVVDFTVAVVIHVIAGFISAGIDRWVFGGTVFCVGHTVFVGVDFIGTIRTVGAIFGATTT